MASNELKPCPFCGGEAQMRFVPVLQEYLLFQPYCTKCFCLLIGRKNVQEAIEAWNRRVGEQEK